MGEDSAILRFQWHEQRGLAEPLLSDKSPSRKNYWLWHFMLRKLMREHLRHKSVHRVHNNNLPRYRIFVGI